ncbi:type II secretion system protein J [Verrucomicrobiota bacterium]
MMSDSKKRCGFTLVEVSVAATLFILTAALVMSGTMHTMKKSRFTEAQNELDMDAQLTIESLRNSMRLSSLDEMHFYPEGAGPYTAISFPLAKDDDNDGMVEKDANGNIIWDKTIIYHIWPGSPNELRITTFSPRDVALSDLERQKQLNDVVEQGVGSRTYNGNNATSRALFENLIDWSITPRSAYDAYAPVPSRDQSASVGYCLLGPGAHEIEFQVTGKNSSSSGYKIGLDTLVASTSGDRREGEAQLPVTSQSGAAAVAQYMEQGSWSGNHHLYFPATTTGQKFKLTLYNDLWHETNFRATGHNCEKSLIEFDKTLSPQDFVVKLDGNTTAWEASAQTGGAGLGALPAFTNASYTTVRTLVRGSEMVNGGWLEAGGGQCRITFNTATNSYTNATCNIRLAKIGECKNSELPSPVVVNDETIITFDGLPSVGFGQGYYRTSDWVDHEIDKDKSYLITYIFFNGLGPGNEDGDVEPRYWEQVNGASQGTYYIEEEFLVAWNENDWTSLPYQSTNGVLGISKIETRYEKEGTYTSPIYDTQMESPDFNNIEWDADLPSGTAIEFKVRTGVQFNLSDAPVWSNVTASASSPAMVVADRKRYVQFQATLKSSADCSKTPLLKDVTIDWPGEERMVDIGGIFTKGPDYGTFSVEVDGEALRSAVVVKLEIYKDVYGIQKKTKRISSEAFVELRPRNSGK